MSWVRAVQLIATTVSVALLSACELAAQEAEIHGNCNVIAPRGRVSGNITYTINCNNISNKSGDQIERILSLIEESSREASPNEFAESLEVLMRNSRESLDEIKKTRAPLIVLTQREFKSCDGCYAEALLLNEGGQISRVDDLTVLETATAILNYGKVLFPSGEVKQCPYTGSVFERNWIVMDYSDSGYGFNPGGEVPSGGTVGRINLSTRFRNQEYFKWEAIQNYNEQRQRRLGDQIDTALLDRCTEFRHKLGIKASVRTYGGSAYEQYFVLKYHWLSNEDLELEDVPFEEGASGFNALREEYYNAVESRKISEGSEHVNTSVIATFMLDHSE